MDRNVDAFCLLVFTSIKVNLKIKFNEMIFTINRSRKKKDLFKQPMLEYALKKGEVEEWNFYEALYYTAHWGELTIMCRLLEYKEHGMNVHD